MEIRTSANKIIINGNIKSISDFQNIKTEVDAVAVAHRDITIEIVDSLSITSSVIGYLNKLILKDGIAIHLKSDSPQLLDLLDDLGLTSTFKATRI